MAHEITVPLLPCGSIDEIVELYTMLGFTRTYYQVRPYPCGPAARRAAVGLAP